MISAGKISWVIYKNFEGPKFVGSRKVPVAGLDASFHAKVLTITSAAEGGGFDATQMYDSGLCSIGAIQFIDASTYQASNLLGAVAEACGLEPLVEKLKPALDMANATFGKTPAGKWRFSLNGKVVDSAAAQKTLYFGDANGNAKGTFTPRKKELAQTWAACLADVWSLPGSTEAQTKFTIKSLQNDFTWGTLKSELFGKGTSDSGWVGATKALLLSFAVNAPAIVVKRYDVARSSSDHAKFSPEWCLDVLRSVAVEGKVDSWQTRWNTKSSYVEKCFGVVLPTYRQLVDETWPTPTQPKTPTEVVPAQTPARQEEKPVVVERKQPEVEDKIVLDSDIDRPARTQVSKTQGFASSFLAFLSGLLSFLRRR